MRHVFRTLRKRAKWTQVQAGEVVGVSQQTAGKLLGTGKAGFSRPTALRLAIHCGFDSPESMLQSLGVAADAKDAPSDWLQRDIAVAAARRLGYAEAAIEGVIARFTEERHRNALARWWMDRIVHLDAELAAESAGLPEAPASEPAPKSKPAAAPKRRRQA